MLIKLLLITLVVQIKTKVNYLRGLPGIFMQTSFRQNYARMLIETESEICYGTMFDAGSSGTRVYVYQWPCRETQTMVDINITEDTINQKVKPGLSAFANNITGIPAYLNPLIDFAKQNVPSDLQKYTPILLGGTAGMRLLPQTSQDSIIQEVRTIFENSSFLFIDQEWARVISGQDEGAYMWMSVNYLLGLLDPADNQNTALTIDIGGASTQISFRPGPIAANSKLDSLAIPNFNSYEIYTTSYLGYGNDQARISVLSKSVDPNSNIISTPCYHQGYSGAWEVDKTKTVQGTGQYLDCLKLIDAFLNVSGTCPYPNGQCSINNFYQPTVDSSMPVYGMGSVYQGASFLKLENFTLPQYYNQIVPFVSLTWDQVQNNPTYAKNPYVANNYFLELFVYELIKVGYKIPETSTIRSPLLIHNVTPSWTLAGTFYQISQIDCEYDSPVCKPEPTGSVTDSTTGSTSSSPMGSPTTSTTSKNSILIGFISLIILVLLS